MSVMKGVHIVRDANGAIIESYNNGEGSFRYRLYHRSGLCVNIIKRRSLKKKRRKAYKKLCK